MEKKQNVPALRFQGFSGEWNTHTLESMCDVFTDGDWIEANDQSNVGIRLIQTGNIGVTEYTDKPKHKKWISKETFDRLHCTAVLPGDILISRLPEPAGRACVIPDLGMEMITAVDCTIARVAEAYSKEYLVQYLSTAKYFSEVRDCLAGGTRQRISRGNLSIFTIPVPADKTEQDKIGDFFEWLDNCIAVKKQKIQKLQQFRQAMLTKLFPREGAAEPELRFRGFSGKWRICTLAKCAALHARIGWQNLRKSEFLAKGDYYLITGTDFVDGQIEWRTCHYVSKLRYDQDKNIQVQNGDILVTKDGTLGKVAYVDGADKPATLNAGVFNVKINVNDVDAKYLYQYLKGPYLMDYVNQRATGGTIKHLNQNILVDFPVVMPSFEEQKIIGDFFYRLDRYISLQQKKLERMQRLKAALLEKLFV